MTHDACRTGHADAIADVGTGLGPGEAVTTLAVLTSGLWRLRRQITAATGADVVRWSMLRRPSFDAVGGWGAKPTAADARALAAGCGKPYVSLEDGWIRSLAAGPDELPRSLLVDTSGTHYDAGSRNDLEDLVEIAARRTSSNARARRAIELLREEAISKYNAAPRLSLRRMGLSNTTAGGRVLVVDQTMGDASISGAFANADTFFDMLAAARAENPEAEILIKTHPEVTSGRKRGYLSRVSGRGIRLYADAVNPWSLFEAIDRVYVVSSQLGFEALMAGLPVSCFGVPYYAGWGLTDDRVAIPRRKARPSLEQLFAALYFDYARYVTPGGELIDFEEAILDLIRARDRLHSAVSCRLPLSPTEPVAEAFAAV